MPFRSMFSKRISHGAFKLAMRDVLRVERITERVQDTEERRGDR